jgi:two-component system sensor histidine kinase YesM
MGGARRISAGVLVLGGSAALALLVLGSFIVASLRRYARLERMEIIARFDALKAKVDPHFLFNTLDGMVGLIETKDLDGLTETVRALAFMLRSSVRGREDEIPLREEIEYVRSYLHLQRIRYGSTFKAIFDIPPEALERRVLRFSIQPLVENSFRHGIHEGSVGVSIRISARLDDAGLTVEVSDDGPGTEPEMIAALAAIFRNGGTELGASGGLANVHARLRLKYGPPFGLSLIAQEKGFGIRMLTLGPSIVAEAASGPQPLAGRSAATGPKPNYFR